MSSESEGFGPTRGSNFHLTFKSRPFVPANPAAAVNSPCPSRRLCVIIPGQAKDKPPEYYFT
jgi:hypothetical protein